MKIIFTSCMDAERVPDQPIWDEISKRQPDVLMLLGDQIYMDWGIVGRRNWRRIIDRDGDEGLQAFATAMYSRYSRQWGVASFRSLITSLKHRGPAHLLMTWDDHDFAWNNSWGGSPAVTGGGDGSAKDKHHVPDRVKRISHSLFRQFESVLREAAPDHAYPPIPKLNAMLAFPGDEITWRGRLAGDGPFCHLLDTRWHRQGRVEGGDEVALLGEQSRQQLMQTASESSGLLVVAAGTPMWHKGLFSHAAWCSEADAGRKGRLPAYAEYAQLLKAAKRPVLFLGGDIHKNAFTGRLQLRGSTQPGQVVQILSSGAAIGRTGPKRFLPSFGEIVVSNESPQGGFLAGELVRLRSASNGSVIEAKPMPELRFGPDGWPSGQIFKELSFEEPLPDAEPLQMLLARPFERGPWKDKNALSALFEECDELFESEPAPAGVEAKAVRMVATGFQESEPVVRLDRLGPDGVAQTMLDVFQRARRRGGPAVFFIHGFGKSLPDATGQGYQLRDMYECEPMVYVWEAGRSGGLFKTFSGITVAMKSAEVGGVALSTALLHFNAQAGMHPDVTSVVLARSTGALALGEALFVDGINKERQLNHVTRIVLSAPLISERDWSHRLSFADLIPQVVITRNRTDETLNLARWIDGEGSIMGFDGTFRPNKPTDLCVDFSNASGVFDLHDYLLSKLSSSQIRVNLALLREKAFDPLILNDVLVKSDREQNAWNVR